MVLAGLVHKTKHLAIRHVAQNAVMHLPYVGAWRDRISPTGAMNKPAMMVGRAGELIRSCSAAGLDLSGARIAEIGPGHSLGTAVTLLLAGAKRVTALDLTPFADATNWKQHQPVFEEARDAGLVRRDDVELDSVIQDLDYTLVEPDKPWPIEDQQFDLVYSYYAGEHLRNPRHELTEACRVLRPGGVCFHRIDLRDHYQFNANWLQFLYYEPWLYNAMTSRRGKWCNRLRASQWRSLVERYMQVVEFTEERRQTMPRDFRVKRLATPFQGLTQDELSVSHLRVVARC